MAQLVWSHPPPQETVPARFTWDNCRGRGALSSTQMGTSMQENGGMPVLSCRSWGKPEGR